MPSTPSEWKGIEEELQSALPLILPSSLIKRLSCDEVVAKFEKYLYDFISQRVPQTKTQEQTHERKNRHVIRLQTELMQNRQQKLAHKRHLRELKRAGLIPAAVEKSLKKTWRVLLKTGNRLRRRLKEATLTSAQRQANTRFRSDPHAFAKNLFHPPSTQTTCSLSKEDCDSYFPNLYKDANREQTYAPLPEMIRPPLPTVPFDLKPPSFLETKRSVLAKRNGAAPGRDGINYLVYKRLPTALFFLHKLIVKCWTTDVANSWAHAAISLLHKDGDPLQASNYRPIALTNCSGKVFFSLWSKRLESFLLGNKYFDRTKQKGFLSNVAGCPEHIAATKAAIRNAKDHYRQLVIAWIDLKNAFGSVNHNLIQFALWWYHVPPMFARIMFLYYELLVATIEGKEWSSKPFVFAVGVFQGCCISPLLFNIVFNLLLDLLSSLTKNNGYRFKSSTDEIIVHEAAYADDLKLHSRSTKHCQSSINMIDKFLSWTRTMAAKPPKCKSLAFKFWTKADDRKGLKRLMPISFPPFDPVLTITGKPIDFIADKPFKDLGWIVYHDLSENEQRAEIQKKFILSMQTIDNCSINGFMKLWLYQHYAVQSLAWPFLIYDLCLSFAKSLEKIATRFLKKWANIYKRALVSCLYRPRSKFGLQLQSIVSFYQRLQINRAQMLKYCPDKHLSSIYAMNLTKHETFRTIWKPEPVLEKLEAQVDFEFKHRGQSDHLGLGHGRYPKEHSITDRKNRILELAAETILETTTVHDMDKAMQGCFLRFEDACPFDLSWTRLIGTRNPRLISWVINASTNSVITPDLRRLWGIIPNNKCALCSGHAHLCHILSGCHVALAQGRYTWRHDSVLCTIEAPLQKHIESQNKRSPLDQNESTSMFVKEGEQKPKGQSFHRPSLLDTANDWQLQTQYTGSEQAFPVHICVTDLRPDIVVWSLSTKKCILIELTCPVEENILDARAYKTSRYNKLKSQIEDNGWTCHLRPIECGARGMVSFSVHRCFRALGFSHPQSKSLCFKLSSCVARCSFAIYRSCAVKNWTNLPLVRIGDCIPS